MDDNENDIILPDDENPEEPEEPEEPEVVTPSGEESEPPVDTVVISEQPRLVRTILTFSQRKLAAIAAALLVAAFGSGWLISDVGTANAVSAARSAAYDEGYEAGEDAGYESGKSDGYEDGEDAGYQTGYDKGKADGYESGKSEGYESGKTEGYQTGYDEGKEDGYESGKSDGYDSGYEEGKKDGKSEASALSASSGSDSGSTTSSSSSSGSVYVSYSGGKIHSRSNCSGMKNYMTYPSLEAALADGYVKCKNCY